MKHLALYVIATVNTDNPPPPITAQPSRTKRRFRRPAWLRLFKATRLDSREALT